MEEKPVQLPPLEILVGIRLMRNQMEERTKDGYVSTTQTFAMRDGHENEIHILKHENVPTNPASPLAVLVHAGGFTMGTTRHSRFHGATEVNMTYRLAPEHVFSTTP